MDNYELSRTCCNLDLGFIEEREEVEEIIEIDTEYTIATEYEPEWSITPLEEK